VAFGRECGAGESGGSVPDKSDEDRRRRDTDAASVSSAAAVISMSMHASVTLWP
jgi:hypothetical protein